MSVVATNIDAMSKMIERDWHVTYSKIQASLGIERKQFTWYYMISWTHKNFAVVGSHTIWLKLKNRFVLNGGKKFLRNSTEIG